MAPDRVISGAATTLSATYGIAYDSRSDSIFAGNWNGNHVVIYDNVSGTTGDVAPSRTLVGASTGITRAHGVFVDEVNNLLYVSGSHGVAVFANASTIDGDVAPARLITGAATLISGGGELRSFVDTTNDRLYVSDPNATSGQILIFDNAGTRDGNVAPDRVISGANTNFSYPWGMTVDIGRDLLYVGDQMASAVFVFANASTADGDVAPDRAIGGAATGLFYPGSIVGVR